MLYHLFPIIRGQEFDMRPLAYKSWGIEDLAIPEAWKNSRGKGVKVGIIDTGVPNHKDLPPPVEKGNSVGGSDLDRNGHHTHVKGTIFEIAPEASFYDYKVLSDSGGGSDTQIAKGIDWMTERGVHITNASIGGGYSRLIEQAIQRFVAAGGIFFAATGNSGPNAGVDYPGRLVETIGVAAYRKDRNPSTFSSGGPEVDIICPGEDILSTIPGNRYGLMSGTSMATPHATGIGALYVASRIADTWARDVRYVRKTLAENAIDIHTPGKDNRAGYGIPNVTQLVPDTKFWLF